MSFDMDPMDAIRQLSSECIIDPLTHWGRDNVADISVGTFRPFSAMILWIRNKTLIKYIPQGLIHPSTKSLLAGFAWSFSLSQARQLCKGLSVANLRQAAGDFKGNVVKIVAETEVMDVYWASHG